MGFGELSPIELGQRLLWTLPKTLTQHFEVRVLGDTAFGSIEMLTWVKRRQRTQGIFGVRSDRRLADGRHVTLGVCAGSAGVSSRLRFSCDTSRAYWLEKDDGTREQRFVVSTKPLSGVYITLDGRRRWQIEGFFKRALHRFGLHRGRSSHSPRCLPLVGAVSYCLLARTFGIPLV